MQLVQVYPTLAAELQEKEGVAAKQRLGAALQVLKLIANKSMHLIHAADPQQPADINTYAALEAAALSFKVACYT